LIITAETSESLNLYAFNSDGDPIEGFPLLVGGYSNSSEEPVHPSMNGQYLTAISPSGDFRIWRFPNAQNTQWESRYGNGGTNKLTGRLSESDIQQPAFTVLNKDETYNWPNPASDETFLRFQTSEPGDVQIRITTTSGRLIYNQTHQSRGGAPEEIRCRFEHLQDWEQTQLVSTMQRIATMMDAEDIDAAPMLEVGSLRVLSTNQ
jgi:hypothetical protein